LQLRILGSSGAAEPGRLSSAYLVGESLAVDAGALASGLPLEGQRRLSTVLLTHRHFDHLRELPLFLDNVFPAGNSPVSIGAERGTLQALFRHVMNDDLWPDIRRFRPPLAKFFTVRPGGALSRDGMRISAIRLHHTVPTVGYVFRKGRSAAAILGDTGYHESVFRAIERVEGLELLVIEVSYPSRLEDLARRARHLTPALLERGLAPVRRAHPRLKVIATHLKPPWAAETEREIESLRPRVLIARDGDRHRLFK
jgi:ribonuclease BN (tRNA processing enzyme)